MLWSVCFLGSVSFIGGEGAFPPARAPLTPPHPLFAVHCLSGSLSEGNGNQHTTKTSNTTATKQTQAAKRARHLRHPQLCLDAIAEGVRSGGAAGLKKEGECFAAAAALDAHKALVHVFFAQRSTKKVCSCV